MRTVWDGSPAVETSRNQMLLCSPLQRRDGDSAGEISSFWPNVWDGQGFLPPRKRHPRFWRSSLGKSNAKEADEVRGTFSFLPEIWVSGARMSRLACPAVTRCGDDWPGVVLTLLVNRILRPFADIAHRCNPHPLAARATHLDGPFGRNVSRRICTSLTFPALLHVRSQGRTASTLIVTLLSRRRVTDHVTDHVT